MGGNNRLENAMVLVLETQATMQQTIVVLTHDHVRDMDGFRCEIGDVRARLDRIEIILSHHGELLERQGQLLERQGQLLDRHEQILERNEQMLESLPDRVKQAIGFGCTT